MSVSTISWCDFDLPTQEEEAKRLEQQAIEPGFWDNSLEAQTIMRRLARLHATSTTWRGLAARIQSTLELIDLALESQDFSMAEDIATECQSLSEEAQQHEFELVLSGEYDDNPAILAIHAGAGGTDSQDWAEMLLRMYTRWAEQRRFKCQLLDLSDGEEAGIKSATLEIIGPHAYGYAKSERGVHRLVRLSPFDSAHARHTSFALVEVLPEAGDEVNVTVDPDDLEIDTFKASGAGGQHVQKNSTAVRMKHLPSGIVVSCQNERSLTQNKEAALKILKARLMERELARKAEERERLKGDHISAGWGNQIRSYVLHPYKLVKDHRTAHESTNPEAVLAGELDGFIKTYLLSSVESDGG